MAWNKDMPIAPFYVYKEGTIPYNNGERECMESFTEYNPSDADIRRIHREGRVKCGELDKDGIGFSPSLEFRAFKDVELALVYDGFGRGRSGITFYWRDGDNVRYPMFAAEVDRLINSGIISNKMGGLWSAEKRGRNYGIRLERLFWRSASNADVKNTKQERLKI